MFVQQPGATNPNVWAIDNFTYTLMIPEPSSWVLGTFALGAILLRRLRRS